MNKNAFTLVEIIVVVSIIFILTSILVANFPKGREQFALQRTSYKLIQDLRRAQEMAMSAREECCDDSEPCEKKANGFGIYFDKFSPHSYLLFANCDESYNYIEYIDKDLELIDLEKGTEIFSLSTSLLSIVFAPPSPITYVNGSPGFEAQIVISLESDTSRIKIIEVNKTGLIKIK